MATAEPTLHVDIPRAVAKLQAAASYFELRKREPLIFKGRGLEFEGFRSYNSGEDDASNIDWKASLRSNKILVKQYRSEVNARLVFFVDVSDSMVFGSTPSLKCEYAAELASAFLHLSVYSGSNTGFALFNNKVIHYSQPTPGYTQFQSLVAQLTNARLYGGTSDISGALKALFPYIDRSLYVLVLVSDFLHISPDFEQNLRLLRGKTDIFALVVRDPLDSTLPTYSREVVIEDAYSQQQLLVNPKIAGVQYAAYTAHRDEALRALFVRCGVAYLELSTNDDFAYPLARFLKERSRLGLL